MRPIVPYGRLGKFGSCARVGAVLLLVAATSAGHAADDIFFNGFENPSTQIADLRALSDGAVSVPVSGAVVTHLKGAIGDDPAGFFVQAEQSGPAIFVAVDPATTVPPAQPGDRVSFIVTSLATLGGLREATSIDAYSRQASGLTLSGLTQNVSLAADLVTALGDYESELISLSGTFTSSFSSSGTGFVSATLDTAGISGESNLRLRVPTTLADAFDLANGCTVFTAGIPMWRFNAIAEPSPEVPEDFAALDCPAPQVASAVALAATSVRVRFDRQVDPASVMPDGSQFVFDNGLMATGAAASGRDVVITTTMQTPKTMYLVTAATSITDTLGTALDGSAASANFIGFQTPAALVLNEVGANISSSHDLIELRATGAGSTLGVTIVSNPVDGGGVVLATLPDIQVVIGDLIVVHLVPIDDCTETVSIDQCPNSSYSSEYDTAWDVAGGTSGISYTDRVLSVDDATGAVIDAVEFAKSGSATTSAFLDSVHYTQSIAQWLPADCNGQLCTDASTPTVEDIAVDWTGLGTDAVGPSVSRHAASDTNQATDWRVEASSSWGLPNP